MQKQKVCAVILAAGLSTRFGGGAKALRALDGKSFLQRMVEAFRGGGVDDIVVVTGHQADECRELAQRLGAATVHNPNFAQGMFSSIQAGLRGVADLFPQSDAVLLSPVDAALLLPRSVAAMLAAWREQAVGPHPGRIILAAMNGRPGHPALIPTLHIPAILARPASGEPAPGEDQDSPRGLRGYYQHLLSMRGACQMENYLNFLHPAPESSLSDQCIIQLPLPDAGVLSDLDSPNDSSAAENFLAFTQNRTLPSVEEAWQLLCLAGLNAKKMRHSILVARASLRIGLRLKELELLDDLLLVFTSGILHDVLRLESEHAVVGAALLEKLGWPRAAFVAGCHSRLPDAYFARAGVESSDTKFKTLDPPAGADPALADELFYAAVTVYMADKYARRDHLDTIANRFKDIRDWFRNTPEAIEGLDEREKIVLNMESWLSKLLGRDLLTLVSTPTAHPLEIALSRAVDGAYEA